MKKSKGGTLVDKLKVLIFVEDVAQENLIRTLFCRIAGESGLGSTRLDVQVPYSRGGASIKALKVYLDDYPIDTVDCFVLGSDGNCKGFAKKKQLLEKNLQKYGALDRTILAIPDPHIERWYVIDPGALSEAVGASIGNYSPKHKCDKGHYKKILKEAIFSADVEPLQGGAEYGQDVGEILDIYKACKEDAGFKSFFEQVKAWAAARV